ncbi:MAG: AAA-associated domain-containing protein [Candidatus Cloacimonetes bacterium]|nr:AAA-associated domain-containing protein [Candidatus Cloacimonadota bacterium]
MMISAPIPQADNLVDVIKAVEAVGSGRRTYQEIGEYIGKGERQGRYYRKAGMDFGLLKSIGKNHAELTEKGRQLLSLQPAQRRLFFADLFQRHQIFSKLLEYMQANHAIGVTRDDIIQLLTKEDLAESTALRRASTAIAWFRYLDLIEEKNERYHLLWRSLDNSIVGITDQHRSIAELRPGEPALTEFHPTKGTPTVASNAERIVKVLVDIVARERKFEKHEAIVAHVAMKVNQAGGVPRRNQYVDLYARFGKHYLFEIKTCGTAQIIPRQIRLGVSQLLEYRYLQRLPEDNTILVLVLEQQPVNERAWYIQYLLDIGILPCWESGDSFQYPTECSADLKWI